MANSSSVQPNGNNVTVIGQAPQPGPMYLGQQVQQPFLMPGNPGMNSYNPYGMGPQVIPAPGIPGGGPPMLVHPQQQPGGGLGGMSGVYVNGQPGYPQPGLGAPVQTYNASVPPVNFTPDVMGIGRTAGEVAAEQAKMAEQDEVYQPQDFKPADDSPSRFYPVREVDGTWTQRSRFTIDNLDCRWYLHQNGYFYAVRLSD